MNSNRYTELLDDLMMAIEDAIEDAELDIDYETANGILTLTCPNHSQIILSRQSTLRQLWMAAKSGGFHFGFNENRESWVLEGKEETLTDVLNRCLTEQYGKTVKLDFQAGSPGM